MRIETYIPGLSKNTIEIVKHAESLGYDALVSGELNNEPFLPVLLGLEHSNFSGGFYELCVSKYWGTFLAFSYICSLEEIGPRKTFFMTHSMTTWTS